MNNLYGKKLLILGGIALSCEIVKQAHAMGATVYVTDYLTNSPAKKIADKSFIVDATHVEEVVKLIKQEKIDGVLTGFVDMLLPYYQQICERAGLPCYATMQQIEITTDKIKFKNLCRNFDVPVVEEYELSQRANFTYPLILKPIDNSGGRGVTICKNADEFDIAYSNALSFSPSKHVLIERYMTSKEVSLFYIAIDGEIHLTAMGNRYVKHSQNGVIPLPVAYFFPSQHLDNYLQHLNEKIIKMFKSIGIQNGIIFIQSFVENGECVIYEMGYRLTGSLEYKLSTKINGINPLEMLIRFALTGKMTDCKTLPEPHFDKPAANITFLAKPGVIGEIKGVEQIRTLPGVIDLIFTYLAGEEIPQKAVGTLAQVILRVFIVSETKKQLKQTMDEVHRSIEIHSTTGEDMLLPTFDTHEL
ncbi:ATP-grasp domain-containing protein [Culturomica massiliensis]|jgi:biotin carboxylase|uniref:ATP-grasp domain-containing protein n=1 Tax=Culturomica massiliensis TaxID=1841857 RepID=UPI000E55B14E|nr:MULTISPECIES: ATP-grasp domain-containing protein [Odoribacteraceae]RHV92935.1 ATP-grasp domain-containing protein [Odoribacter sp. OF09-27XD]